MVDTSDMLIFWAVVIARFLIPLSIPRYPLPGVLACLILDAVDQTIFQLFTNLPLEGYQSYDKSLDIYYLSITYLSTCETGLTSTRSNWIASFSTTAGWCGALRTHTTAPSTAGFSQHL
ncbi:hypothetical protein [Methanosarcina horonobensis]|uniref:hypothetical protein n=1 Tax=Methanosarcina horonobensis TaxID=418008 RepID=UPI000AB59664|nr:hypothetical protein [Methanosarcina horonobensis]